MANERSTNETALREAMSEADHLRGRVEALHRQTGYEDLAHAVLGLEIVHHALEEVQEQTGLGGHIPAVPDPEARRLSERWLRQVRQLEEEARAFLTSHPSEDLETAVKALQIAEGSLEEVAERYV